MPITVNVGQILAGYTAKTVFEGEEATLIIREFVSSEDGDQFDTRIKGIPNILLSLVPEEQAEELMPVRAMVAILHKDTTATLYLDTIPGDLEPILHIRSKRGFDKGEGVALDDIADVDRLQYKGVHFPDDAGVAVCFRFANRIGFFYDLSPIVSGSNNGPREMDVEAFLGTCICYLSQQHLFQLEEDDWRFLFDSQWFPFIGMKVDTRRQLVERVKARLALDDLLPAVAEETKAHCENLRAKIRQHKVFAPHRAILEHALNEYLEGDYISSTAIVYPRIEGVMRSLHRAGNQNNSATQSTLATAAVTARGSGQRAGTLLLPDKFLHYLRDVYFASFDPNSLAAISRNSVGHGIAQQDDFNLKAATLGLLTLDQMSHFLPDEETTKDAN